MAAQPGTFCWFECASTNPPTAKAFYAELFGWTAVDVPMPGDAGGTYTLFKVGEKDVAGLFELGGPQFEGVPSHWMTYVGVADADETAARATTLGAEVLQPPIEVPGVGRLALFADPTGAHIAIFQPGAHDGTDAEVANLGWSELHTTDKEAAKAFYTQLFGWNAKEDPSGHYTEFQVGDRSIGGMMAIPDAERSHVPPHWLVYALVGDCDASMDTAKRLGGKTLLAAQDVPNVGRFGVVSDPAGAAIALIKLTGSHS